MIGAGAGVRLLRSTPGRLRVGTLSGPGCAARLLLTEAVVLMLAEVATEGLVALGLRVLVLATCWLEELLCAPSWEGAWGSCVPAAVDGDSAGSDACVLS